MIVYIWNCPSSSLFDNHQEFQCKLQHSSRSIRWNCHNQYVIPKPNWSNTAETFFEYVFIYIYIYVYIYIYYHHIYSHCTSTQKKITWLIDITWHPSAITLQGGGNFHLLVLQRPDLHEGILDPAMAAGWGKKPSGMCWGAGYPKIDGVFHGKSDIDGL